MKAKHSQSAPFKPTPICLEVMMVVEYIGARWRAWKALGLTPPKQ